MLAMLGLTVAHTAKHPDLLVEIFVGMDAVILRYGWFCFKRLAEAAYNKVFGTNSIDVPRASLAPPSHAGIGVDLQPTALLLPVVIVLGWYLSALLLARPAAKGWSGLGAQGCLYKEVLAVPR